MRLKVAKLRYPASIEDLDLRAPRGLDRALVMELATGSRVSRYQNVVLTGPTGVGKSYVACALAQAAIRTRHSAYYVRAPRPAEDLALGRADGRYGRLLAHLARTELVVLDDFLLTPASVEVCRDLLENIEDRAQRRSTMVVSQLPVDTWHPAMADPTLGEAILDGLLQALHRIALTGPSMRQRDPEGDQPRGGA
jgi:DNA replication protein DnaC